MYVPFQINTFDIHKNTKNGFLHKKSQIYI